ncbi:MAG: DMT family transporter [Bacteroidia bacterium]|nr:DMT family transporter [Bacteroidia bacterium]
MYFLLVLIWGSSFILMKKGLVVYSPFQVAALRITIAAICLAPFAISAFRQQSFQEYPWSKIIATGLMGTGIPAFLFPFAQKHLDSSTAGILNSLTPLFTIIIGLLWLKEPVPFQRWVGLGLGMIGAGILVSQKSSTQSNSQPIYGLLIVIATMLYGLNINTVRKYLPNFSAKSLPALSLGALAPFTLLYLMTTDFWVRLHSDGGIIALGYISILSILGTSAGSILFYYLVKKEGPVFATSGIYLIPVIALGWGFLDDERLGWGHFLGLIGVLSGVWLVNQPTTLAK